MLKSTPYYSIEKFEVKSHKNNFSDHLSVYKLINFSSYIKSLKHYDNKSEFRIENNNNFHKIAYHNNPIDLYLIFLMVYKMLLDEYIFRNQSLPYKYL